MLSDLRVGFLLAQRARYFSTSLWLLVAVIGLAFLSAQFSARHPATVALDVGLSVMRLLLPLLCVFLTQELLSREFDRRYCLTSLTYPRPRYWLLLGRLAAVLLLVYALMAVMALTLGWIVTYIGTGYTQTTPVNLGSSYLVTVLFMAIDLFVLTALASLLAIVASTPSFVLIGTLGFMLAARSYSSIIALLNREHYLVSNTELYQQSLSILNYLLPDLAALDVRTIALYDKLALLPADWGISVLSSTAYGIILVALSLIFLQRKRVSE